MNWYIGQEIVCIKTHSEGLVKKNETYIIQSLKKCCSINIDVGVRNSRGSICSKCMEKDMVTNIIWFSENLFAPLMDISELESILNKQKEKV